MREKIIIINISLIILFIALLRFNEIYKVSESKTKTMQIKSLGKINKIHNKWENKISLSIISIQKEYLIGEPVIINVALRNTSNEVLSINKYAINQEYCQGSLNFYICKEREKPVLFDNTHYSKGELLDSKILIPGDSIKSNWYLTYTENRYTFPEQGKYQFYVTGEISSNILEINVKEPTGVDEQAFKLFDKNGKYIMTRNESDHKDSMLKDFKQLIDLYPESKYVLYANTYLGRVSNKKVRPKAIRRVRREKIR